VPIMSPHECTIWFLSCEVDMIREFFDPTPEQQNVVLIDAATLHKAERLIESCEGRNPDGAEIPFDVILDQITGSDPSVTDYILEAPAKCPHLPA
jgi:hypothetical protein